MYKYFSIYFLVIPVLFLLNSCQGGREQKGTELPNIIYINVDDLGWSDTEVFGSTFYETPNINRLALEGMTFTNGYAGASNCAPSRACLMSGQNTPRHGMYTVANSDRGNTKLRRIVPTPNTTVLHDSVITIAEMLKTAGYRTGTFGKWHLGEDPTTQGFDINIGGSERGNPGKSGYFSPYNLKNLQAESEGENLTDRLTDEAIKFMEETNGEPFFLYLPYYAVHTPLQTFRRLEDKYAQKEGNEGQFNARYAGMVETVDTNIGKLLSFLKRTGLDDHTLVIFTSDNGGIRDISYQDPLRAGKGSYYEGGIRVPYIFKWKGVITPDSKCETAIVNLDIFPTLMELTRAKRPEQNLDGVSLMPLLKGRAIEDRALYFHFPIYLEAYNPVTDRGRDPLFRTRPGSVIIDGKWKLHHYFEDDAMELYNIEEDVSEARDLVSELPGKAAELYGKLDLWRAHINAPVPKDLNPEYDQNLESEKLSEYLISKK